MAMTKYVLPVVAGTMTGGILIKSVERGLQHIYPLPSGIDVQDKAALASAIKIMPFNACLLLLAAYAISSFAGGGIATAIAGRSSSRPAIITGIILTIIGLVNIFIVPQPLWFSMVSLICYIPFAYLGYIILRTKVQTNPPV